MSKTRNREGTMLILLLALCLVFLSRNACAETKMFQWLARMGASMEHSSNINLDRDNEQSDWIISAGPGVSFLVFSEETRVRLDYDVRYAHYLDDDDNDTLRHTVNLSGFDGIAISENMTLDLQESFNVSEEPLERSDYVTSERRSRDRYYRNTAGAKLNYHFGENDVAYMGFHHIWLDNEAPDVEDSQRYRPMAGITYWFDLRNAMSLDYEYTHGKFDVSDDYDQHRSTATYTHRFTQRTKANLSYTYDSLDYDGDEEDYIVHEGMLKLSHQVTERFSGTIGGGYYVYEPEVSDSTSRFTGTASLDGVFPLEKGSLSLNATSGYRRQDFEAENLGFSLYQRASANFNYRLLEHLSATMSGFYQRDDYLEQTPDREDERWGGGGTLKYRFFDWLSASAGYQYRKTDSTIDANDFEEHRIIFSLDLDYIYRSEPIPI